MSKHSDRTRLTYIVFGIYCVLLAWLVLFKFATNVADIPHMRNLNLVPFADPSVVNGAVSVDEIMYNLLVFIPFGMYMHLFLKQRHWALQMLPALLLSVLFELTQYVFAIGGTDITDVLMNTSGGIIGVALSALCMRHFPSGFEKVLNYIGLVIELLFIALLSVVLVASA